MPPIALPHIAMLVGSLRAGSINRQLAQAVAARAAGRFDAVMPDLDLPLYNEDLWRDPPAGVTALKQAVERADGVIVVTPEYNRMTTPIILNAIDWANRPVGRNSWAGKPAAIIGASPGAQGTAVAQSGLRHFLTVAGMHVLAAPEAYLTVRDGFFDPAGGIADARTGAFIDSWIAAFTGWVARISRAGSEAP